ncbi:MAG: bifunctional oligoribonuclease/PAP phosphatase NrnA [Lachnospiraceae bacterium]|nr:bifunctional oligoribonuclease/PAP phosphatase NrnA [Lachnospiraceae bacterium]
MKHLDEILQNVKTVGISGHVRPDGDCVGSTLGVLNYIKTYFPQIEVSLYLDPIPNIFKFLRYSDHINSDRSENRIFDLYIALDCGDLGRLGDSAKYFEAAKKTLCVDHHVSNQSFADENVIDPNASSTCELVCRLIDEDKITKEIAECLYTGMVHDTGVFQYTCTSRETMDLGGMLMQKGIDFTKIVDETFYQKTFNQNKILGKALLNSKLYLDGQVNLSVISLEEMAQFDCEPKHLDGIVQQLRVTKGVRVAVFLYENEDHTYKVSTRANDDTDLAALAMTFNGGGHKKAAGFTIQGPLEEAIHLILGELEKNF